MIVIGDVHGRYDLLMELVDKLPNKWLCFVGDLIDRGPDSKKVVDFVMGNYACVMGNHEDFLISSLDVSDDISFNKDVAVQWMSNGGSATLKSFGSIENIYPYIEWFKSLPLFVTNGDFLVSHSYAPHGIDTEDEDILWGRDMTISPTLEYINIFGHTPSNSIKKYYDRHYCIDTGAFYTGILSAIDTETMKIYNTKE